MASLGVILIDAVYIYCAHVYKKKGKNKTKLLAKCDIPFTNNSISHTREKILVQNEIKTKTMKLSREKKGQTATVRGCSM